MVFDGHLEWWISRVTPHNLFCLKNSEIIKHYNMWPYSENVKFIEDINPHEVYDCVISVENSPHQQHVQQNLKRLHLPNVLINPQEMNTRIEHIAPLKKQIKAVIIDDFIPPSMPTMRQFLSQLPVPTEVYGNNENLSTPMLSFDKMVQVLGMSAFFLNFTGSRYLPIFMLYAMAAGCVVISLSKTLASEYIEHGKDGFLVNTPEEMIQLLHNLKGQLANLQQIATNAVIKIQQINEDAVDWDKKLKDASKQIFIR
jgi:glycosyltransferase involved in cell wall biosynthesis